MLTWWPLLILLSWCPIVKVSQCSSFEDQTPIDKIFKQVFKREKTDNIAGYQDSSTSNSHQVKRYLQFLNKLFHSLVTNLPSWENCSREHPFLPPAITRWTSLGTLHSCPGNRVQAVGASRRLVPSLQSTDKNRQYNIPSTMTKIWIDHFYLSKYRRSHHRNSNCLSLKCYLNEFTPFWCWHQNSSGDTMDADALAPCVRSSAALPT